MLRTDILHFPVGLDFPEIVLSGGLDILHIPYIKYLLTFYFDWDPYLLPLFDLDRILTHTKISMYFGVMR